MTDTVQHKNTDEQTEYNYRCRNCRHSFFNADKAGRRIFGIGKCLVKDKYIVSSHQTGSFDCENFIRK